MRGTVLNLARRSLGLVSAAGILFLGPGPAGGAEASNLLKDCLAAKSCTASQVQSVLDRELASRGIEARVYGLADQRFAIALSGQTGSAAAEAAIKSWVEGLSKSFQVLSNIEVGLHGKKTDLWFLTFRSQSLTGEEAAAGEESDPLIAALQAVYGDDAIRRAGGNRLLLYGSEREIGEMKRFLALTDTPYPQVQLSIWAIQVTGSQPCIAARTEAIRRRIRDTRDRILEVRELLRRAVRKAPATSPPPGAPCACLPDKIERRLCHAGLDLDSRGNLSLNEVLLFLILDPKRHEKIAGFLSEVEEARGGWSRSDDVFTEAACGKRSAQASEKPAKRADGPIFPRLSTQLAAERYDVDWHDFEQFGNALACFKDEARAAHRPDAPRRFAQTAAAIDGRLKAVMDAFAEDMGELLFQPLLADIQGMAGPPSGKGDPGISMVGQSRLVVTSAMKSALSAQMASFVESTRPKPFDMSLLDQAFPAARDADRGALSGAAGVLSGLPQAQALLLAAALTNETEPTFTQVAPGISIDARPTVFPDGGTARLLIEARFSTTTTLDTETDGNWSGPPPDHIASHTATTDAAVNPFDLLELSSFQQETSAPRSPYFVPILGRLPILGPAFQIPRKPKKTHHESLLLVNSVILPRAVELQRFYSRNQSPDFPLEGLICRDGTDVEEEILRARETEEDLGKKCGVFGKLKQAMDSGR